ncbi:MAG: hypothetical protein MUC36_13340 [Planctomycetes bacterium]|nr:hypothetical protein [Planctomycetota bacterium]
MLVAAACSGGGAGTGQPAPGSTTQPELLRVQYGRLVDVYGIRVTPQGAIQDLFQRDVVIGANIEDQRPTNSTLRDDEVTYDFQGTDPDTLQPRLFIPRDMAGGDFKLAFDQLDDELREVTPMLFGQGGAGTPFSVVPRNAALKLTFSAPLGVDDSFFVARDAQGRVTGLRNTEAVQLLSIEGDPALPNAFVPLPVRVIAQAQSPVLVLDAVLLGTEGLQYQAQNIASGMPASADQFGANIRVALAVEGPLALPSLREPANGLFGVNNSSRRSIVRDFRSGNAADTSSDLARGFVRDTLPLRLIGEIVMYLESVETINAFTQEVTIFKNGVAHEIDRGDVFRFINDSTGIPFGSGEVVVDPADDLNSPAVQHVRVRVRRVPGLESIDPRNIPGYPADLAQREPWLVANAPRAVCVAEYTAGGIPRRDDPRNFLVFSPAPLPLQGQQPAPDKFVSPFAGAVVRFTKPVDLDTVRWADTLYFAMRDLTSSAERDDFIQNRPHLTSAGVPGTGLAPTSFDEAKYRTPFLVTARVFDEDASQTSLRLQPTSGFFLNEAMRNAAPATEFPYFLHLISQSSDGGIRDLAGNPLDLQGTTAESSNSVVIPFTVDTRRNGGAPLFPDNISVSLVRRFASRDEDENPSYFLPEEVQPPGAASKAASYPLEDLFGAFVYIDNKLQARPTTRTRVVADNLNQSPVVQAGAAGGPPAPLAWCPAAVSGEGQVTSNSAANVVNAGIQNPLNPFGCRLQTVWREIDLSLSRTDPFDFNLDIEQMYWAPYTATQLSFDEFDRIGLTLGHSEFRPAPCVGDFSSQASMPDSGLSNTFELNYAWNPRPTVAGQRESQAPRRSVYADFVPGENQQNFGVPLTIDPASVVFESNGVNRFLPLSTFRRPFFVYRDETVMEQGGRGLASGTDQNSSGYTPYIASPFSMGQGRRWLDGPNGVVFANSFWNDLPNQNLTGSNVDQFTGGLVGSIALPLLADFWTFCDSPTLPEGGGYVALGTNGWQVSVTVQSGPQPNFRVYSAGRAALPGQQPICRSSSDPQWSTASGGFTPGPPPGSTIPGDNTFYWIMMDVLKRQSVITNGFVDINNPHRVPEGFADPRLGPFFLAGGASTVPANLRPNFAYEFDPPLDQLPTGTSLVPQFRAASIVDPTPWYWNAWMQGAANPLFPAAYTAAMRTQLRPTASNFPLDPYKAGDAHLRKWDTRVISGGSASRNWWTYNYNRTVTRYVEDPNDLVDPAFTIQYQGPNEAFTPRDVRYVNWRFVTSNNTDASPPVLPVIETFALSYRFQPQ